MAEWHIITCEYPPQFGGVSDYTYQVANGLAATGDSVHVWCPSSNGESAHASGVTVHREFGRFSPSDLRRVGSLLNQFQKPRRLLVQWVPHGYGYMSMNLAFCLWLWKRARLNHDCVDLMVHEPFLSFGEGSWRQDAAAIVHRIMTIISLNEVTRVWTSIPAWEKYLCPYALGRSLRYAWLPIPSSVPVVADFASVSAIRSRYAPDAEFLIGHFGTYGRHITDALRSLLPQLLSDGASKSILLIGQGSESLRDELIAKRGEFAGRIEATGSLTAADLSRHVSACDVMVQPYPDGISSRRTSAMVGLSHGIPIVTTTGHLTDSLWPDSFAVAMASVGDTDELARLTEALLSDSAERQRLGAAAKALYQVRFDIKHTIAALRA